MNPAEPQDFASLAAKEAWERSCAGKDQFPSLAAAQTFAQFMHQGRIGSRNSFGRDEWMCLRAYKCHFAPLIDPHWHLGHVSG